MDLFIRTGFQAVKHSIPFNPETQRKGKALAISHVVRVEEVRTKGVSELIRGSVIRQTSVTLAPYQVKLELNPERHVVAVSCTCVSQAGGKCKHVYGLIHYINSDRSASKTSVEQEWGKPTDTQLGKDLYSKGIVITDSFKLKTVREKPKIAPFSLQLSDVAPQPCALLTFLRENNRTAQRVVNNILSTLLDGVVEISRKMNCEACALNLILFSKESDLYFSCLDSTDETLLDYYRQEILLSEPAVIELCVLTEKQSDSEEWFTARKLRISASSKAHAIKVRSRKTVESLLNDFFNPFELKGKAKEAVQYGIRNEMAAISEYETRFDVKVVGIGLFVLPSQPWLCASPDGVVVEDGCITKLLEVKCPSSCNKLPVVNLMINKSNVPYLNVNNGVVDLKSSHKYFTQCQMQMYVTGLTICDFYVWSPKGSCLVTVHRDEKFLHDLIPS